jgi:hypothetical protein
MNAYPRLSEKAYADEAVHRKEVVEMIADTAADMWRYYRSKRLTDKQQEELQKAIEEVAQYW